MAVISTILGAIGTAAAAIGSAVSTAWGAVSGFLGTTLFTIGGGTVTGGSMIGAGGALTSAAAGAAAGGFTVTVGGALAGIGLATTAAIGLTSMYQNARASANAQKEQAEAIRKLYENQGTPEVNETGKLQENGGARVNRTLSSLRISMLPQKKNEEITQNVYGVDSNTVANSTQNMLGLNIATA